jgi:hypothetical protein
MSDCVLRPPKGLRGLIGGCGGLQEWMMSGVGVLFMCSRGEGGCVAKSSYRRLRDDMDSLVEELRSRVESGLDRILTVQHGSWPDWEGRG